VLWTTHLTDEVRDGDALLVLHRGRVLADGTAGEIRGNVALSDWFLEQTQAPA
jgi:ABC-2 type transport system ATP-binding protein